MYTYDIVQIQTCYLYKHLAFSDQQIYMKN